ncbi:uncharacterized protein DC041_0010091, partial [Schistosoma bovis]
CLYLFIFFTTAFVCIYCWYLHERNVIYALEGPNSHIVFARITCIVGFLSALGMSIVANFQGFKYHALSSFCEWLMSFTFLLFFASMIFELRNYELESVKVSFYYCHYYL